MGFFKSSLEKQLEQTYSGLMGDEMARDLVKTAKEKVASEQALSTPPIPLDQLRSEGVTQDDWDWWWGMQPLERAAMIAVDELTKTSMLMHFRGEGLGNEDAIAMVRRSLPLFGNPNHRGEYASQDDRPLPRELKGRVTNAAAQLGSAVTARHTSMNALIRERLRSGGL